MRYIDEYRNADAVRILAEKISTACRGQWAIMEVCGGQTNTILRYGLEELLPDKIRIVHGPGCPVCVTPLEIIDRAISISREKNIILVSYGDMLRVPGSEGDLLSAKAEGADVRIIYSPLDALKIAKNEKDKKVVFFAVGFETTAPANAQAVIWALEKKINNFFMLCSHMLVLPAVDMILSSTESRIQGILAPGHVCTVAGYEGFIKLSEKHHVPIAVTGFEPVDILQGILYVTEMLEKKEYRVINQYSRSVKRFGNTQTRKIIERVYEITDRNWRGIGVIPKSGLKMKDEFREFDAERVFEIEMQTSRESAGCIAGEVLRGVKKPFECKLFGSVCVPARPSGAPMVSSEGTCAAYYRNKKYIRAQT